MERVIIFSEMEKKGMRRDSRFERTGLLSKKSFPLLTLVLLLAFAGNAQGLGYHYWTGIGDGSSWGDSDNWDGDGTEGSPYSAHVPNSSYRAIPKNATIVIDGYAAVCDKGNAENCTVTIKNGGSFSTDGGSDDWYSLNKNSGTGTWNVYAGTIDVDQMYVAYDCTSSAKVRQICL